MRDRECTCGGRVWEQGVPGKLGSRGWQSPRSSRRWPWEKSPAQGTRNLAHLRASEGPRALSTGSSRAPSPSPHRPLPRPQGQTGTRIPQAGQTSRRHLLWFTDGSGGDGTPNHTGGHDEAGPAPALPARPAGFSASTGPPCLQASPTGASHPEVLLPSLQNLGGAPDPTDRLGPGPGLGVDDDEEGTQGIEVCWPTAPPDVPDLLYDAGRVLPALPSPLLADPHPTPPSDLQPCSLGLGLDHSSKMASLAHELWRPSSRPSKTRATLKAAPPPTPVPSQENGNISGRGYELLGTLLCCVCRALWNPGGLGGRAPAGTHAHCCLFPR